MFATKNDPPMYLVFLEYSFLALLAVRGFTEQLPNLDLYFTTLLISPSTVAGFGLLAVGGIYLLALYLKSGFEINLAGVLLLSWTMGLGIWVLLASANFGVPGLTGIREWIRIFIIVLTFFVTYNIARRWNTRKLGRFLAIVIPVPLAAGYYQMLFQPDDRAYGMMVHPNPFALFLVAAIGLTLWLFTSSSGTEQYFWGLSSLLLIPPLIATVSSNGWLMFLVVLGTFSVLFGLKEGNRRYFFGFVITLILVIAVMVLIKPAVIGEIARLLETRTPEQIIQSDEHVNTLEGRIIIWTNLIGKWYQRPIVGYGLNTSQFIHPITGLAPHNDYVRFLSTCGGLGLFWFVGFIVLVGWQGVNKYRKLTNRNHKSLGAVVLGLYLGWIIASAGDNVINVTTYQLLLWSMLATFFALPVKDGGVEYE